MEVEGRSFQVISYSVVCEKPKNLEIFYYIYDSLNPKENKSENIFNI